MDKARLDEEFSDFVAAGWRRWSHTAYLLTRDTGDAEGTSPHLHFEIHKEGKNVDPLVQITEGR